MPVLPETKDGNLLFHLELMTGIWCSVELEKFIEMGYIISHKHAGFKYKLITGLMNTHVEFFLTIETCGRGVNNAAECD